ncbi:ABC transporter substrate-binding protein [Levilactobacillus acidifarinae]|uniref:Sugar ABC transporter substrate-binding protein n=1 Tax=Levilactobacillus acidifarinae DSM 19394 = JCM 15949 TaxID=1423715 RepID=A0A0R1LV91_9LACO|nr:ABC transporter substrate-binding protein [Levilactobacillus acidifarinae]KRK96330.1 sugar ABC transporter substrate-binding protein [Levilactobacillus acidifarinae DSM 19394]GEO69087.1 ABC transporter substrate-binding protein [Levilactobacillus acidifarinae]
MKRLRQFLLLGLGLLTVSTLTACAQSHATTTKPVTITFWHGMTDQHQVTLNHLISQFNHSQTRYKVVASGQGNFANLQQKITAAAKSQTLPTIAQTAYTNVPTYVQGGFVTPLTPYLKTSDLKDVYPVFLDSASYRGKTYAFPFSKSARVLFYNRKLLAQTGLRIPKTWSELAQDGEKVQVQGLTGVAFDQSFMSELDDLIQQTGTPLVSDKLKVNANSQSALRATHVITDMLNAKTATTAGTDGYGSTQFFAGKTLFYCGSSAAIPIVQASAPKGLKWGTAPLPSYRGRHATSIAGNDLVLFKSASTAQRKVAAAFMKFMLAKPQTTYWAQKTGYLPLTKAAQKDANYQHYLAQHPTAKAANQSLPFGFQDVAFLGYPQYLVALSQATDKMASQHQSPKKAMGTLQTQTEKIIQQNR